MFNNLKSICRKIVAVGRNYKEHAAELGNVVPVKPIIFIKPSSSIILEGESIKIPKHAAEIHHEVELGIVISKKCHNVSSKECQNFIAGYVLALDLTDRTLQNELKKNGYPWTLAKCFDTSCPISKFIDKSDLRTPENVYLSLLVNGQIKQHDSTKNMIWNQFELISFISDFMTLETGDIILTGTPSGVSSVKRGDLIEASIDGIVTMKYNVI